MARHILFRCSCPREPGGCDPVVAEEGEEVFTVIKRIANCGRPLCSGDFNPFQQVSLAELVRLGVVLEDSITGDLALENPRGNWGACLECAALICLGDLHIQGHRDVKVKYPYPEAQYDPDGQTYDVLGGLDLSSLLWLECKAFIFGRKEQPSRPSSEEGKYSKVLPPGALPQTGHRRVFRGYVERLPIRFAGALYRRVPRLRLLHGAFSASKPVDGPLTWIHLFHSDRVRLDPRLSGGPASECEPSAT